MVKNVIIHRFSWGHLFSKVVVAKFSLPALISKLNSSHNSTERNLPVARMEIKADQKEIIVALDTRKIPDTTHLFTAV